LGIIDGPRALPLLAGLPGDVISLRFYPYSPSEASGHRTLPSNEQTPPGGCGAAGKKETLRDSPHGTLVDPSTVA